VLPLRRNTAGCHCQPSINCSTPLILKENCLPGLSKPKRARMPTTVIQEKKNFDMLPGVAAAGQARRRRAFHLHQPPNLFWPWVTCVSASSYGAGRPHRPDRRKPPRRLSPEHRARSSCCQSRRIQPERCRRIPAWQEVLQTGGPLMPHQSVQDAASWSFPPTNETHLLRTAEPATWCVWQSVGVHPPLLMTTGTSSALRFFYGDTIEVSNLDPDDIFLAGYSCCQAAALGNSLVAKSA